MVDAPDFKKLLERSDHDPSHTEAILLEMAKRVPGLGILPAVQEKFALSEQFERVERWLSRLQEGLARQESRLQSFQEQLRSNSACVQALFVAVDYARRMIDEERAQSFGAVIVGTAISESDVTWEDAEAFM